MATRRSLIDVEEGQLTLSVNDEKVMFNIYQTKKFPDDTDTCHKIVFIISVVKEEKVFIEDLLEHCMIISATSEDITTVEGYTESKDLVDCVFALVALPVESN